MTLFSLFADAARKAGDRSAIRLRNSTVSYSELYDRVLRYAAQLEAQIARPGGVALVLRDRVELLSTFLACATIGRPAAPIDPDLPPARLKRIWASHFAGLLRATGSGYRVSLINCVGCSSMQTTGYFASYSHS